MARVSLELNHEERQLILKCGYPGPSFEAAMLAVPDDQDLAILTLQDFELELLLGDLAYSINRCRDVDLQLELDDLYCYIERITAKR